MIELDPQLEAKIRMGEELGQRDRVLVMLRDADGLGVCGTTFSDAHIPRYSARIGELRDLGWPIPDARRCHNPNHWHKTKQFEWVLGEPADPTLF